MPEKLNKILEQLPEEYREVIKEVFNALIEEMKLGKDNKEIWQAIDRLTNVVNNLTKVVEEDRKFNQEQFRKVWQAINRLTNAIEKMEKTFNERFERQEKENEKIWQNIERIWQSIEKLENTMKEGFEKQAQENEKIWQAIKEGFERQEKENQRIWQAIEEMRKDMKEGFERQAQENEKIWQAIKEGFERQEKENQRIWQAIEEDRRSNEEQFRRIWQAIEEMRKSNEEQFKRIWQAIEEDRKSNEEQFKRIWQAIEKTNERLDKLILAFEKAEKRNEQTRKQVGVLTDNFGYLLEDRAIRTLPKLLKEKYGFEITEPLRRDFIEINGKYIEVNIYGKARKNNEEFIIIGEAKTRITNKAIIGFLEKCNNFEGKQFRIMIGYLITPKIKQVLENNNIIFINSYELEL
jgi:DNA repair exonuclease SbcCD ATPase subunit